MPNAREGAESKGPKYQRFISVYQRSFRAYPLAQLSGKSKGGCDNR
jgi:hypothetical protein